MFWLKWINWNGIWSCQQGRDFSPFLEDKLSPFQREIWRCHLRWLLKSAQISLDNRNYWHVFPSVCSKCEDLYVNILLFPKLLVFWDLTLCGEQVRCCPSIICKKSLSGSLRWAVIPRGLMYLGTYEER